MIARSGKHQTKVLVVECEAIITPLIQLQPTWVDGETIACARYEGLYDSLVWNTDASARLYLNENRSSWKNSLQAQHGTSTAVMKMSRRWVSLKHMHATPHTHAQHTPCLGYSCPIQLLGNNTTLSYDYCPIRLLAQYFYSPTTSLNL